MDKRIEESAIVSRNEEKKSADRNMENKKDTQSEGDKPDNRDGENKIINGEKKNKTDDRSKKEKKVKKGIKYWAERKGISMTRLADKAQISKSTLSGIVNGEASPYLHTLEQICDALEISLEELLDPEKEKDILSKNASLTEEETELVVEFRKMPQEQKKWLLETVRMLRRQGLR